MLLGLFFSVVNKAGSYEGNERKFSIFVPLLLNLVLGFVFVMGLPEKYKKEIEAWKKKPEYKESMARDGFPKTPLTPNQYEMFREEGEKASTLFRTHFIRGKWVDEGIIGSAMSGWARKVREINKKSK